MTRRSSTYARRTTVCRKATKHFCDKCGECNRREWPLRTNHYHNDKWYSN